MTTVLIHLPEELKAKLDAKRSAGYSISGFIRNVLEKELGGPKWQKGSRAVTKK